MATIRFASLLAGLLLGLGLAAVGQNPAGKNAMTNPVPQAPASANPASANPAPSDTVDNDFVHKQFGTTCTLMAPAPMTADFDGDGVMDILIVARCKNALIDQEEKNFQVVDPFNSFFGYGDTKISTQFASEDPALRGVSLLVIHGAGAEAWRSDTPKAKFVIINMPFKQISVKRLKVKKKAAMAIYIEETGPDQMTSVLFWDGKKYKYNPIGSSMDQ